MSVTDWSVIKSTSKIALRNVLLRIGGENPRFFDHYRADFCRQFRLKEVSETARRMGEQARAQRAVCLHVHHLNFRDHAGKSRCIQMQFYFDALAYLRGRLGVTDPVWVFTDSVDFCRETFREVENLFFFKDMARLSDDEEFHVMTQCASFIISDSTFAWWVAYLSGSSCVIASVHEATPEAYYLLEWHKLRTEIDREAYSATLKTQVW